MTCFIKHYNYSWESLNLQHVTSKTDELWTTGGTQRCSNTNMSPRIFTIFILFMLFLHNTWILSLQYLIHFKCTKHMSHVCSVTFFWFIIETSSVLFPRNSLRGSITLIAIRRDAYSLKITRQVQLAGKTVI